MMVWEVFAIDKPQAMATKNFLWFIMLWTLDKFSAAQLI
jgi:hypothetical protein